MTSIGKLKQVIKKKKRRNKKIQSHKLTYNNNECDVNVDLSNNVSPTDVNTPVSESTESDFGISSLRGFNIHEDTLSVSLFNKPLAVDCEMVGVGEKKLSALGRVSIVDYFGNVVYDIYCRPQEEITDYRTPWSGIRPHHMEKAIPLDVIQEQVSRIFHNRIIIGHMIGNDFSALQMHHPKALIRDTARNPYVKQAAGLKPGKYAVALKKLTAILFGRNIQQSEHCSVEDSRATLAIYKLVEEDWEKDLELVATMKGEHLLPCKRVETISNNQILGKRKRCNSTDKATAAGFVSTALTPDVSYLNDEFWDNID